jgi:hypothetical protein
VRGLDRSGGCGVGRRRNCLCSSCAHDRFPHHPNPSRHDRRDNAWFAGQRSPPPPLSTTSAPSLWRPPTLSAPPLMRRRLAGWDSLNLRTHSHRLRSNRSAPATHSSSNENHGTAGGGGREGEGRGSVMSYRTINRWIATIAFVGWCSEIGGRWKAKGF